MLREVKKMKKLLDDLFVEGKGLYAKISELENMLSETITEQAQKILFGFATCKEIISAEDLLNNLKKYVVIEDHEILLVED